MALQKKVKQDVLYFYPTGVETDGLAKGGPTARFRMSGFTEKATSPTAPPPLPSLVTSKWIKAPPGQLEAAILGLKQGDASLNVYEVMYSIAKADPYFKGAVDA